MGRHWQHCGAIVTSDLIVNPKGLLILLVNQFLVQKLKCYACMYLCIFISNKKVLIASLGIKAVSNLLSTFSFVTALLYSLF